MLPEDIELDEPDAAGPPAELAALQAAVAELGAQAARGHARAEAREKTIDRLHDEVERLRAGEARALLRPAVSDLRRLHGDLMAQARSVPEGITRAQVIALLESFADSAELALERCGVTLIRPLAGRPYDPRLHQVMDTVPADRPDVVGTVLRVLGDGYAETDTGRTLAPARLVIYARAASGADAAPS